MRLIAGVVLGLVLSATACNKADTDASQTSSAAPAKVSTDPARAKDLIAKGAVVIDVRTPDEFGAGHVERATNIPIQDFATRLAEVEQLTAADKSKPVVLYCGAGRRAQRAKEQLEAAGYTAVVNGGGYDDLH